MTVKATSGARGVCLIDNRDALPYESCALAVKEAIALLAKAQRPVILAGSGVWWSDASSALRAFVDARTPLLVADMSLAFEERRYDDATSTAQKLLATDRTHYSALMQLAAIKMMKGDLPGVIAQLKEVREGRDGMAPPLPGAVVHGLRLRPGPCRRRTGDPQWRHCVWRADGGPCPAPTRGSPRTARPSRRRCSCSWIARVTAGCPCPRHDTAAPPDASRYSRPLSS